MSDLDFEQRHRLENEVLPDVISDPEHAASTIVRLEAKIEWLRELVQSAYIEGHGDGNSDESLGFVGDWRDSTTRAALAEKEDV